VVHAETGAVQELCEIARDTPPALITLPSGDVLLSRDTTSRFLGARPRNGVLRQCTPSCHGVRAVWHGTLGDGPGFWRRCIAKTVTSVALTEHTF